MTVGPGALVAAGRDDEEEVAVDGEDSDYEEDDEDDCFDPVIEDEAGG